MSRQNRLAALASCALALALAAPAAALDLGGHDRDGTVIGLDMGIGWHEIDTSINGNDVKTNPQDTFTGGLRVGWAKDDHLIYSLGIYGWKRSYYQSITPITVSTFHFLAEVSWFPRGQGFWLRGGVGGGSLDLTATLPEAKTTYKKGGWNYSAGAGYEFRVADETAVGLSYTARYLTVGAFDKLGDTTTLSHNLALSISFYM